MIGAGDLGFTLVLAGAVTWTLVETLQLGPAARFVPQVVIVVTLVLILAEAAQQVRALRGGEGREPTALAPGEIRALAWVVVIVGLIAVAGGAAGTSVTLLVYLRLEARVSWKAAAFSGLVTYVMVDLLQRTLGVPMPRPMLFG
ncbi:MAG: hypothetical protein AB7I59_27140 [Geminicoccaceae bacterium]